MYTFMVFFQVNNISHRFVSYWVMEEGENQHPARTRTIEMRQSELTKNVQGHSQFASAIRGLPDVVHGSKYTAIWKLLRAEVDIRIFTPPGLQYSTKNEKNDPNKKQ